MRPVPAPAATPPPPPPDDTPPRTRRSSLSQDDSVSARLQSFLEGQAPPPPPPPTITADNNTATVDDCLALVAARQTKTALDLAAARAAAGLSARNSQGTTSGVPTDSEQGQGEGTSAEVRTEKSDWAALHVFLLLRRGEITAAEEALAADDPAWAESNHPFCMKMFLLRILLLQGRRTAARARAKQLLRVVRRQGGSELWQLRERAVMGVSHQSHSMTDFTII